MKNLLSKLSALEDFPNHIPIRHHKRFKGARKRGRDKQIKKERPEANEYYS